MKKKTSAILAGIAATSISFTGLAAVNVGEGNYFTGGLYSNNISVGIRNIINTSNSNGSIAVAIGYENSAQNNGTSALGVMNKALGLYSIAVGYNNTAKGDHAAAFGTQNTTEAYYSSAMGYMNKAEGHSSSAVGFANQAAAVDSSAFGSMSRALGENLLYLVLIVKQKG